MTEIDGLTPKQRRALRELLQGASITAAAKAARVTRATVSEWFNQNAGFRAAYRDGQDELISEARAVLKAAAVKAAETLRAVMDDSQATATERIRAAVAVLESLPTELPGEDDDLGLLDTEPPGLG